MTLSYNQLIAKLREFIPQASVDVDNQGQLIVYTDMRVSADSDSDDDPLIAFCADNLSE
jgi:hypothetical protein